MEQQARDFIHGIARKEAAIRSLRSADFVHVSASEGEYAGTVETVNEAEPGEGNYVVVVNASVYNGAAMDATRHTLVLDYEGALESDADHYAPYVVATANSRALGDVQELGIDRLELVEGV